MQLDDWQIIGPYVLLLLGLIGGGAAFALGVRLSRRLIAEARAKAAETLEKADQDAESRKQEILMVAQEKALGMEEDCDRREQALDARELEIENAARDVEQKRTDLGSRSRNLDAREASIAGKEDKIRATEQNVERLRVEAERTLERTAGLTASEAKTELIATIEEEARREGARVARKIEDDARERAERDAANLLVQATQSISLRDLAETTVTYIQLPSDEMKGRIIGREGRNIRALENATGIDLIVDDTPQAILISCFDPVRREVARVAIERLVEDGRIHPARIEEVVERVRSEVDDLIEETGNQAAFTVGMSDLPSKLVRRVGRMHYRTNHGHNLLQHCLEVALLAGYMAGEVGARVDVVHRAGLFHEIGRVDESVSGHSALASAELVGRFDESEDVIHAIQALHPDVAAKTTEAILLQAANRISDNRPGARKDNLEIFVERLRRIETIANRHEGVRDSFAVKAGKEIRVIVDAQIANDEKAYALSKSIARALEQELAFPGQIKVSVIRETRAIKFAV